MPDDPIELDTLGNGNQQAAESIPVEPASTESVEVQHEEVGPVYAEPPLSYEESMRTTPALSSPTLPPPSFPTQVPTENSNHDEELPPVYSNEEEPPTYEQVIRRTLKRKECWMSSFIMLAIAITFILQFGIQLFRAPRLNYVNGVFVSPGVGQNVEGSRDGTISEGLFRLPADIAVAKDGTIYITDSGNHVVRQIDRNLTQVTTLAGSARSPGTQNGNQTQAQFRKPWGIAFDANENLIITDSDNCSIRNVTRNGEVTTLFNNDPCTSSNELLAIAVSSNGSIFFSTMGRTLERLTPNGSGFTRSMLRTDAFFGTVNKMLIVDNVLYMARQSGHIITLNLETNASEFKNSFANNLNAFSNGYSDGDISSAILCNPFGIAFSPKNNSLIYASSTCSNLIKLLTPREMFTVAGTFDRGVRNGPGSEATFATPLGMAFIDDRTLLVVDHNNHQIRRIVVP
jgi:sugar lactone lactonase YvrE